MYGSFNCYGLLHLFNASYIRARQVVLLFRSRVRPCVNTTQIVYLITPRHLFVGISRRLTATLSIRSFAWVSSLAVQCGLYCSNNKTLAPTVTDRATLQRRLCCRAPLCVQVNPWNCRHVSHKPLVIAYVTRGHCLVF